MVACHCILGMPACLVNMGKGMYNRSCVQCVQQSSCNSNGIEYTQYQTYSFRYDSLFLTLPFYQRLWCTPTHLSISILDQPHSITCVSFKHVQVLAWRVIIMVESFTTCTFKSSGHTCQILTVTVASSHKPTYMYMKWEQVQLVSGRCR